MKPIYWAILAVALMLAGHSMSAPAAELHPKCHQLFVLFEENIDNHAKAGGLAKSMHRRNCWPALQGDSSTSPGTARTQPATSCDTLVPYIIHMANKDRTQLLNVHNPKPMTYAVIDQVSTGHGIFQTIIDNRGRSARVRQSLKHNGKVYIPGKQHYMDAGWAQFGGFAPPDAPTYGDKGTVLVPDSPPFAARPPTGAQRILDCSGEGRHTSGMWWIQMTMDRDASGEEFAGLYWLAEIR